MTTEILTVKCPQCKKDVEWTSKNIYRPFCSKRCQLIDLGEWADEEKTIPGEEAFLSLSDEEHW
ncbi:DNA gyrase inhibitor [Actinobacillus delphinicola]|uniref:DNA gyrase inhibitor YacG n=1 Tax=Actinobacillus delphinicola TaxID=51161 RepID=A0A448TTJ9_9PAST|nr:DNA gyrase inhibitor YacG [Actinobacillus delphinicola]MDG6897551.1 DNA gyrase inhibitor [Actinobacillus delphinicola]VEJ09225.1 dephospho-CoA kinase [Actinobacillus delphinicola]